MKTCVMCNKEKEEFDFYYQKNKCKQCCKDTQKQRYRAKSEFNGVLSNEEKRKNSLAKIESMGYIVISEVKDRDKYKVKIHCPRCDKDVIKERSKLINVGMSGGCGCGRSNRRSGGKYISGVYMTRLKAGAIKRGYEISVDVEYLESLLIDQNFKCALTGWSLDFGYIPLKKYTLSIDRIDSNKGYVAGNVQIVHKMVNMCKQSYSQEEFINMCKTIAGRN